LLQLVVRFVATAGTWVRYTNGELPIFRAWQAVCTGVGAKVVVKRAVLLHDYDNVLDLLASVIERSGSTR
jgi:hypothetical protein